MAREDRQVYKRVEPCVFDLSGLKVNEVERTRFLLELFWLVDAVYFNSSWVLERVDR
jgi:hypothetical protein